MVRFPKERLDINRFNSGYSAILEFSDFITKLNLVYPLFARGAFTWSSNYDIPSRF